MGAAFGGSSQTVFGTEGPLPLLNKITTGAAILFMITSITLAYLSSNHGGGSVMRGVKAPVATEQKTEQAPVTVPLPSAAPAGQTEKAPQSLPAQEEKPQATP